MAFLLRKIAALLLCLLLFLPACGHHRSISKGKAVHKQKKTAHAKKSRKYAGKLQPGELMWPAEGPVNSPYGTRWGRPHDGIDIGGDGGDPILAAAKGEVVYSGRLGGYGNLIVLKHPNGLFTAYGHNKKNFVKKGERVKQGQRIARMGRTGNATGDHLHFEIRDQAGTYDPQDLLPKERYAAWHPSPAEEAPLAEPPIQVAGGGPDRLEALPEEAVPAPSLPEAVAAPPPEPDVPEDKMMELLSDI